MKYINTYISEKLNAEFHPNSLKYWKEDLGFDPTSIDYSKNPKAQAIIDKFEKADKLSELFDYLSAGLSEQITIKDWIKYVAETDIEDYETYNGKLK